MKASWLKIIPLAALAVILLFSGRIFKNEILKGWADFSSFATSRDIQQIVVLLIDHYEKSGSLPEDNFTQYLNKNYTPKGRPFWMAVFSSSRDLWGTPYSLIIDGKKAEVRSAGPDRKMNTSDDVAVRFSPGGK